MNNRQKRTTLREERIYSAILLEVRTSSLRQVCPFPSAMDFNVVFKDLIFPCRPCSSDYIFRTAWPPFHFFSLTTLFFFSLSLSLLGFCFHYSTRSSPNLLIQMCDIKHGTSEIIINIIIFMAVARFQRLATNSNIA